MTFTEGGSFEGGRVGRRGRGGAVAGGGVGLAIVAFLIYQFTGVNVGPALENLQGGAVSGGGGQVDTVQVDALVARAVERAGRRRGAPAAGRRRPAAGPPRRRPARSTARATRASTWTWASSTCCRASSGRPTARSRRCTWWRTSTATTSRASPAS